MKNSSAYYGKTSAAESILINLNLLIIINPMGLLMLKSLFQISYLTIDF